MKDTRTLLELINSVKIMYLSCNDKELNIRVGLIMTGGEQFDKIYES